MKNIVIYVSVAFVVFFWFLSGSVSRAETFAAPNGESYIFCYHYYGNWQYQNFVYNATYYTNLPLAGYNGDFYTSVDGVLIKLDLSTNEAGVYTNNLSTFRYNGDPSKTIDHCIYVASGQKGYAMKPNPSYPAIQTDIPLFDNEDELIEWLNTAVVIEYTYNPTIGYLSGIKERTHFLDIYADNSESWLSEKLKSHSTVNRVFKFGWASETSTGIDLRNGADITWTVEGEEYYGNLSNLKIQAMLHFKGHILNFWLNKVDHDIPESAACWYYFDDFNPYDPYYLSFDIENIRDWFSDLIDDELSGLQNVANVSFECELYMRVVGVLSDDDDPPQQTNVCGNWVKIPFNAWGQGNGGNADLNIEVVGGVDTVDESGKHIFTIDSDSPYGDGEAYQAYTGGGTSVAAAENNIKIPDASNVALGLSDFFDQVKNVPAVIASVFGFFPSWVLGFFTSCFLLAVLLMVIKTARGG